MTVLRALFALVTLACSSTVSIAATVETGRTLTGVAVEEPNQAYFRIAEALTGSCAYNVIYIDLSKSTGKPHLALLLSARAMGKKLAVIAYNQDGTGRCWVSSLEME
jgi:hypothetical protein